MNLTSPFEILLCCEYIKAEVSDHAVPPIEVVLVFMKPIE